LAERSDTDRKRERRQKKKKQKFKRIAQEERAQLKGLGHRNVKLAENIVKSSKGNKKSNSSKDPTESFQNTKELKSSKAFFAKLQNQVQTQIKEVKNKKKASDPTKLSAKRFKM